MNWLKRVFCAHRYEWMRNIYGDEINVSGGKRSVWRCSKCGKVQYRDDLRDEVLRQLDDDTNQTSR
jgi:Zn-finger protein